MNVALNQWEFEIRKKFICIITLPYTPSSVVYSLCLLCVANILSILLAKKKHINVITFYYCCYFMAPTFIRDLGTFEYRELHCYADWLLSDQKNEFQD